jgi:tryptophan halogenase
MISALILNKFLDAQVDVVHSKDIGIIGVGEGSTEHFNEFLNFLGIDPNLIIKECGSTLKYGILFDGWTKNPYTHSVVSPYNSAFADNHHVYLKLISESNKKMMSKNIGENKIPFFFVNSNFFPTNQYHFNTKRLQDFMIDLAKKNNVGVFEDEINEIIISDTGEIKYLVGEKNKYEYDFYVDCTGFKKMLIGPMGGQWKSFSKHLIVDSAIVFQTEDEDEYSVCTLAKAMDAGWMFKIPTWGKHGNGYIYSSKYISEDDAKLEVEKTLGFKIKIEKIFKFDPGALKNPWINNCVAIGLSGSFVEPLEATSIGTSIQQSFLLMNKIINYDNETIKEYNLEFTNITENIRDFIFLHYLSGKDDTPFWKDVQKIAPTEKLSERLKKWKTRLPSKSDFSADSNYILFSESNYILVMYGLGLISESQASKYYMGLGKNVRDSASLIIENQENLENITKTIGHKDFIRLIRDYM